MASFFSTLKQLFSSGPSPEEIDPNMDLATLGKTVNVHLAAALKHRKDVVLIDVREDWEYANGHIPGARNIPLGTLDKRSKKIPKNKAVILTCRSGSRSGRAYSQLSAKGFENIHNMAGGFMAWQKAGYDTER